MPELDAELAAIFEEELTEELAGDEVELVETEDAPAVTMEISAAEIIEEPVTPAPASISVRAPAAAPAPVAAAACTPAPVAAPAETRPCSPVGAPAVPVRELRELPSTASCIRPMSESTWSVASLDADDLDLPRRGGWWRYTAISAGVTALACALGFSFAGEPAPASAAARPAEPTVVAYDPAALAAADDELDIAAPTPRPEGDSVLARRIALRGTRNLEAGRTRLAREAFEEALAHDADCRPALAGLGRIYFAAGRHKKAADYLAPAVRIEPRDKELQGMLAESYRAIGHHQSAARHEKLAER